MCGIVGIWKKDQLVSIDEIEVFRDTLRHRGPDEKGVYIDKKSNLGFGHRRLAILDLSSQGAQPMRGNSGQTWVVYNGEIYNFQELRQCASKWGYNFHSHTDTEVILAYYERYGLEFVQFFRGMFAIAIWDANQQKIILVRDRVGIKPLYYYWDYRTFAFASECRAFQALDSFDKRLDVSAIYDFLFYQYIPPPKSVYAKIRKLPAATMLVFDVIRQRIATRRYWQLPTQSTSDSSTRNIKENIEALLKDSIECHLVSDTPVGAFLSGGIDSSAIVYFMSQHKPSLRTFTVDFDFGHKSEAKEASEFSRFLHLDHRILKMSGDSFIEFTNQFVDIYDEPFGDTSGLPTFAVSSLAHESVKVVLSGDGGDELFGGYIRSLADVGGNKRSGWLSRIAARTLSALPTKHGEKHLFALLNSSQRILEASAWFRSGQKSLFLNRGALENHIPNDYDDFWFLRQHLPSTNDPIRNRLYLDFQTWLPEKMLTKVDRASMANSLEVRTPLLDHMLVEYVFSLPSKYTWHPIHGGKWIVKEILNHRVPKELLHRPKKGFSVPLNEWLKYNGSFWQQGVRSSRIYREGILSKSLFNFADTRSPLTKWMLLNLSMWSNRYSWSL